MMGDQAEHLRALMAHRQSAEPAPHRVLAIASGKGGVGKSNVCVNMALALQKAGQRPIVIDADVGFADVEVLLGVRPRKTIVDVAQGTSIFEALEYHSSGLAFLSAGNGLLNIQEFTSEQMEELVQQMQRLHEKFNVVLIDSGAGLTENVSRLLHAADELLLVTTPEPTSVADAYALLKMLVVRGSVPPVRLVVNRAKNFTEGRLTADKLCAVADRFLDLKVGVLGYVLDDAHVSMAVKRQEALLDSYPNSQAARCIEQLIRNLDQQEAVKPRGLAGFMERLFGRRGSKTDAGHSA